VRRFWLESHQGQRRVVHPLTESTEQERDATPGSLPRPAGPSFPITPSAAPSSSSERGGRHARYASLHAVASGRACGGPDLCTPTRATDGDGESDSKGRSSLRVAQDSASPGREAKSGRAEVQQACSAVLAALEEFSAAMPSAGRFKTRDPTPLPAPRSSRQSHDWRHSHGRASRPAASLGGVARLPAASLRTRAGPCPSLRSQPLRRLPPHSPPLFSVVSGLMAGALLPASRRGGPPCSSTPRE
jgi:hypothetical protein